MVEVDAGDGVNMGIVGCRSTVNAGVVADMVAVPVGGEVPGIRSDRMLQCLKSIVSFDESRIYCVGDIIRGLLVRRFDNGEKKNEEEDDT